MCASGGLVRKTGSAMFEDAGIDLRRDHAAIEVLARRLSSQIEGDADPQLLATTLGHLVQTVAAHLEVEDALIYRLAMEARHAPAGEVERVQDEFERLKTNWGEYIHAWTPEQIAADRSGFVTASRAILHRLNDRVRLETKLLSLIDVPRKR
jgi:hypothetical protein